MFLLFGAFIIACGTTHIFGIWTIWQPVYLIEGGVKAATAAVSLITALLLVPVIPQALSLRSPAALEAANRELEKEISTRKQMEMALRESEERFRTAFDYAATGFALVSPEGRWLKVNRALCSIVGYSEQELMTMDFQSITHPDDLANDLTYMSQVLAGRLNTYQMEKRYFHKLGHVIWIQLNVSLIRGQHGNPLYFVWQIQDITERRRAEEALQAAHEKLEIRVLERTAELQETNEKLQTEIADRKRAEEALRNSEVMYRAMYDDNPSMYFTLDAGGTVLSVNKFGMEQLGYTAEELVGHSVLRVFYEDDQKSVLESLNECLQNFGRIFQWEFRKVRKEGSVLWVREAARAVKNNQGHTVVLIVCEDITERKRTEETIRESLDQLSKKNRYETIISTVTRSVHQSISLQSVLENAVQALRRNIHRADYTGIYIVEGEEAVLKAHTGIPDWFVETAGRIPYLKGFTWKTIREGRPIYCADTDQDEFIGSAGRKIGIKSYVSMQIRFEGKTVGTLNIASMQKNAFDKEELNLLEIVAHQIEVAINNAQKADALRQSEDALRKANEELEIKVVKRTSELSSANEALQAEVTERRRAEKQIKEQLEEKEVLLKEIHHRVKNNLQVISSLLSLQSRYISDNEVVDIFRESQNRIDSMALVHEKLYQSKDMARVDFAEYVLNLTSFLLSSYKVNSKGIILNFNVDNVFLGVDTAIPCGLIINELVSNSLKHGFPSFGTHTEEVTERGEVRIDLYSDNDNRFSLVISDNGIGFPQDLDFRNTKSLGLQLVCTLTNQLNGAIELNRDGGTKFIITFSELKYKDRG
jgi:PAS domain S-box-containing protein